MSIAKVTIVNTRILMNYLVKILDVKIKRKVDVRQQRNMKRIRTNPKYILILMSFTKVTIAYANIRDNYCVTILDVQF